MCTTINFKCLETDLTKTFNFNKRQSPSPLCNDVLCHFSSNLMCTFWFINYKKAILIGEGYAISLKRDKV